MRVGVPREVMDHEFRVAITPAGVHELVGRGHKVLVERRAGAGSSISDEDLRRAGATVVPTADDAWSADLVVKVKEPVASAATCLQRDHSGRGLLLGGVPGVAPARVLVLGAGTAGRQSVGLATAMGAHVTVVDTDITKLREVDTKMRGAAVTLASNRLTLEELVPETDVLIGTVLVPGAEAPAIVSAAMVASMRPGAVVVDVAIDQGGCVETSRVTTHSHPTYVVDNVVHYCVGNMPGAVPHTSTYGLTNVTLPYVVALADGVTEALRKDAGLRRGVSADGGLVVDPGVAAAHGHEPHVVERVLDLVG